jgi:hypothetical protein
LCPPWCDLFGVFHDPFLAWGWGQQILQALIRSGPGIWFLELGILKVFRKPLGFIIFANYLFPYRSSDLSDILLYKAHKA